MNFTEQYNRSTLQFPGQKRNGRRLFDLAKNKQTEDLASLPSDSRFHLDSSSTPSNISPIPLNDPTPHASRLGKNIYKLPTDKLDPIDDSLDLINPTSYTPVITKDTQYDRTNRQISLSVIPKSLEPNVMAHPSPENLNSLELQQLRNQLRYKELEIKRLNRSNDPSYRSNNELVSPMDLYSSINKQVFDKKRIGDFKKETAQALRFQIQQKEKQRQLEALEKEQAIHRRFEDMELQRQKQELDRLDKLQREKEYRENLAAQSQINQELKKYEDIYPDPSPSLYPERPTDEELTPIQEYEDKLPSSVYYTKKSPVHKTVIYNPITNSLKDTSTYLQPDSYKYNLSPSKHLTKIPADFSMHPAFKQPAYTKSSPKYIPTSPITGDSFSKLGLNSTLSQRVPTEDDEKSNKSLASYGNMVLGRPTPNPR